MSPIPRRKQSRSVPVVLSVSEVGRLLSAIRSPRMLAVSMVMVGSGLRVSEACALRVDDIDAKRDVLRIREGKGGHDRYALLGARLLHGLRTYWKQCRPPGPLLFPNRRDPSRPMTRKGVAACLDTPRPSLVPNAVCTTALIDRIVHHADVISIERNVDEMKTRTGRPPLPLTLVIAADEHSHRQSEVSD